MTREVLRCDECGQLRVEEDMIQLLRSSAAGDVIEENICYECLGKWQLPSEVLEVRAE